jgi:hypothetical protein
LPSLHISHQDHPSQTVWSTPAGQNFVGGADFYLTIVAERASVEIDEHKQAQFSHQMVDRIEQEEDAIAIYGRLQRSQPASDEPQYVLSLRSLGSKELNFQLQIAGDKVIRLNCDSLAHQTNTSTVWESNFPISTANK